MKFHRRAKPKKGIVDTTIVDELGKTYKNSKKEEAKLKGVADKVADHIKELVSEKGELFRTGKVIKGKNFVVGYSMRLIGVDIDVSKAQVHLPEGVFKQVAKIFIDTAKVANLVERGIIKKSVLKKILIGGKPTKYVMVKTKEQFEKEEKEEYAPF